MKKYDYIVIGSGPSAYKMVPKLQDGTKKTLIIENEKFGGICPNFGCEPKIFLEGTVTSVLISQKLKGLGIKNPATIDWKQLIQRKKEVFNSFPNDSATSFQELGADTLQGTASFVDAHTVMVNDQKYQSDKIIIATGQRPNKLPIVGNEYALNSNDVFDLEELPEHVVFIGGGFVSMELATILRAAGSKVDVIEFADRPLKAFSKEHVDIVMNEMQSMGIQFYLNNSVSEIKKMSNGYKVISQQGLELDADVVVDASGRIPNIEKLNLDAIGIEYDRQGIIVDENLETSVEGVYALGDVIKKNVPKLTPTAHFEGEYLGNYLIGKTDKKIVYPVIANAAFTFPQVAQAGVSLEAALKDNSYSVKDYDLASMEHVYSGTNDMSARLSLIYNSENKLVGVSEVSQTAADDVNNFVDIIGLGLTKNDIRNKFIPAFPALKYKIRNLID
ncbi:dihydrolipoyl dehydrogenase family protein [Companilactobacillus jidongensis]|uniref:dihydrolipoyl dehydrogenase family protein n=1 Tax=Companilactobacillus jidongensis TaxID=2486006 RepID=UPI000F7A35DA|nr:NAD(P)/FAD-dependent oxidoreductase [Companilactobacillus jidongensis]